MPRRPDLPPLRRSDLADDPIEQFAEWWGRAEAEVPLPDAICLATADAEGGPDARMVLLKGFGSDGFRFHTNYESAKGEQLSADGRAAIVVYWRELDRQVRVRGEVERLSAEESDAYFATRPPERRVGAWASPQSRPLADRAELDRRVAEVEERFAGGAIPRPEHWGGYVLRPDSVEFWQGQVGRLHDRFRYRREGGGWAIERLGP
jgi:pyridoxamine 5'-phosphate oxidase